MKKLLIKGGRRSMALFTLLLLAVVTFAVPAKPGLTRLLTLSDGSTINAKLVGDEFLHYWLGEDGKAYQAVSQQQRGAKGVGAEVYQTFDLQSAKQSAAARRSNVNRQRARRLAPRKVEEISSISGDKKGIIILVNFTDKAFTATQSDFNNLANTVNYTSGNYKGSMYDYFYAQSDGQFRLTFDVVGPYTVSQNRAYYGANDSKGDDLRPGEMIKEAVQLANADVDFANYDWNGDDIVDQVYVVYAGKGEADGGASYTIWPHEWDLYSATGSYIELDGKIINTYACGGEQDGGTGKTAGIGTMCHEFSHCLGYPDFYDTDSSGGQGMGYWDLMDSGSYNDGGYQPAGYTSYERWVAGWKTPTELLYTQDISNMKALQDNGSDTYIIYNKGNKNEYYLLENRQKKGWDASLPGEGLLILHVDYNAKVWSDNEPNDAPSHQRMTWIAADNNYEYTMSQGKKYYTFDGMANDPFPYGSVNAFGKNTTPAATLYNENSDGTYYLDSSVENITQNSNGTISFSFKGIEPTFAYYQNADGKTGAALKTALCGIIYDRTEKSYNYLWEAFQTTDVRSDGKIWDMYSSTTDSYPVSSGSSYSKEGDCYNREHSFPQSWFGSAAPMYTDLHHIYPTDGYVNGMRSNYPFGETDGEKYKSDNDFSKLGACTYPGYTDKVFEPADEYKGDFARTYFYMVTCYEEKLHDWYTNYSNTEVTAVIDGSTYPGLQTWQLNMLMEWAKNDPVSEKETNRNNAVYAIQNNRNPFIDYPGLEEYIWGSMTTTAFSYGNYVQPDYSTPAVTVPTLAVNNVTDSSADATWTACNGVTEYTLQLASDDQFTEGSSDGTSTELLNEDFSKVTNTSTNPISNFDTYTKVSGWSGENVYPYNGQLRLGKSSGAGSLNTPSLSASGSVTVIWKAYQWSGDNTSIYVGVSEDGGNTFEEEQVSLTDDLTQYSETFTISGSSVIVRWRSSGASKKRFYLDDITISTIGSNGGGSGSGSIIAEETVTGTNYTFTGLDPETTYFARVKGNDDWSDVVSFTTKTEGEAPELTASFGTSLNAYVGETIEFIVTATGIPTPTVEMAATEYDATFDNGNFSFTPDEPGTYEFTFTANNSIGTDNLTVTITVSPVPVTVPELTVADVTSNSAVTSWTACDDVTEYTIQLACDEQFTESSLGSNATVLISEDFSKLTTTGGTSDICNSLDSYTTNSGWTGSKVYSDGGKAKIGSGSAQGWIATPAIDIPVGTVLSCVISQYGSDTSHVSVTIVDAVDNDFELETIDNNYTPSNTPLEWTSTTAYTSAKIKFTCTNKKRFYLDDVTVSSGGSEPVEGSIIATATVTGTNCTITGLSPETTYYARVKGDDDWSNVVSFTTNGALELANSGDNTEIINAAAANGGKYDVTLTGRTLYKDGDWNTLCLPFPLSEEDIAASDLADADIRALSTASFDDGVLELNFTEQGVVTDITAGTPYIIRWEKATDYVDDNDHNIWQPVFNGVVIDNTVNDKECDLTDGKSITFKGTYEKLSFTETNTSILFLGTANKLYYPLSGASLGAQRAYFELDGITAADFSNARLSFGNDEVTLGISEATPLSSNGEMANDKWYTLDGKRLDKAPTHKGLYIHNGKKIVKK